MKNSGFSTKSKVSAFNRSQSQAESEVPFNPLLLIHAKRYATFMRRSILIISLLGLTCNCYCQIVGRTTLFDEGAWTMISVNGELPYKTSDGEGNFNLELPKKENALFILSSWISIEIKNISANDTVNVGEISLPMRKSISIKEYDKLAKKEREFCLPVYCNTELLGYDYKNQLAEPCIMIKCGQTKYEICDFDFDIENQKVVIEWNRFRLCAK